MWLKWSQTIEMKQSQVSFQGTYSNLTSFFIGPKILKTFNDVHNWHLSITLQEWAKTKRDMCESNSMKILFYNHQNILMVLS